MDPDHPKMRPSLTERYYHSLHIQHPIESLQTLKVKPGVKLPRSNDNWSEANNFFKLIFSTLEVTADSVNEAIQFMNNTIYDFFKDNYGIIDSVNQANGPFHK